ncbi:MAG: YwaF family protein [Oscillospiraceae bacterium]|nr:YwaF family protein [Oscillospiraceae bacterium]
MKEFLGFGGYAREAEGAYSWQHLLFVGSLLTIMAVLAILLGRRNRNASLQQKNKVIIASALLIDAFEIFKIVVLCLRSESLRPILHNLPLFLCSIQLIALPLAAFTKGRIEEAAIDFVCIFGILGAVFGTIGAAQNYNAYPVLSMDNVVSGITHCISGFASLYILFSRMERMRKENMLITYSLLIVFCILAYVANILVDYNYMFLMAGDGTPYDILYNLVNGNRVLYPVLVVALFLIYISAYYWIFHLITHKRKEKAETCCVA